MRKGKQHRVPLQVSALISLWVWGAAASNFALPVIIDGQVLLTLDETPTCNAIYETGAISKSVIPRSEVIFSLEFCQPTICGDGYDHAGNDRGSTGDGDDEKSARHPERKAKPEQISRIPRFLNSRIYQLDSFNEATSRPICGCCPASTQCIGPCAYFII
jgi:hypothetical protein